jgi:hypothetical protein
MKTIIVSAAAVFAFFGTAFADPPAGLDTPGIDNGTTLGELTSDFISGNSGRAHAEHSSNPYGGGPSDGKDGFGSGRTGLANAAGGDLSDTIDLIDTWWSASSSGPRLMEYRW